MTGTENKKKREMAQHIHESVQVLVGQAAASGLETLAYVLCMAELEAARVREKQAKARA
jgi:hypothetical protein